MIAMGLAGASRIFTLMDEEPEFDDGYVTLVNAKYDENGELEYYIIDNNFGQPSPANTHDGEYARMLRYRSSNILKDLVKNGYIETI